MVTWNSKYQHQGLMLSLVANCCPPLWWGRGVESCLDNKLTAKFKTSQYPVSCCSFGSSGIPCGLSKLFPGIQQQHVKYIFSFFFPKYQHQQATVATWNSKNQKATVVTWNSKNQQATVATWNSKNQQATVCRNSKKQYTTSVMTWNSKNQRVTARWRTDVLEAPTGVSSFLSFLCYVMRLDHFLTIDGDLVKETNPYYCWSGFYLSEQHCTRCDIGFVSSLSNNEFEREVRPCAKTPGWVCLHAQKNASMSGAE